MPTVHVVDETPVPPERVPRRRSRLPGAAGRDVARRASTWEIRATPADGSSRVEVIGVRHLRGFKGRLLAPFFPFGLAKRTVADHLRHFLSKLEEQASAGR